MSIMETARFAKHVRIDTPQAALEQSRPLCYHQPRPTTV